VSVKKSPGIDYKIQITAIDPLQSVITSYAEATLRSRKSEIVSTRDQPF